ncbi:hypothetical protein EJ110_NYTH08235 [Nymphaea thermarum]|nr:hypothetical protein EJ110_NYTH08235 [Nymphaea thermarum]
MKGIVLQIKQMLTYKLLVVTAVHRMRIVPIQQMKRIMTNPAKRQLYSLDWMKSIKITRAISVRTIVVSMTSNASSSTGTSPSFVMAAKYPYPSNVNVANFVSIKLSHKNYLLWKTQMLGLIESQDMMRFIEGQISILTSTIEIVENGEARSVPNPEFLAWKKSDRLLRGWITGSLSEEVLGLVVGLQTSFEVWTALLKVFARESKDREFLLTRKLQTFQKQEKNVTEYVTGFKTICDELAAIGKPLSDQDKVYWLINGLGSAMTT